MKSKDLLRRLGWTLLIMFVFELGKNILIPGINVKDGIDVLKRNELLSLVSATTGGRLTTPTLFSLGLGPYITTLILWKAIDLLEIDWVKQLTERQLGILKNFITLLSALVQSISVSIMIRGMYGASDFRIFNFKIGYYLLVNVVLLTGAMFIMWLANLNTNWGIGSTSVLIIPGIITSIPTTLKSRVTQLTFTTPVTIALIVVTIIFVMVTSYLNHTEMRIPVQRTQIENDFTDSYIPIRFFPSGAMPFMFSFSIFLIPRLLGFGKGNWLADYVSFTKVPGIMMYGLVVVLLGYVFGFINFRTTMTARGLKESGSYIFGVTPGEQTERFLNRHLLFMIFLGNIYLVFISVTPLVIGLYVKGISNLAFYFGSLTILVTMIDNIMIQITALYSKRQYEIFPDKPSKNKMLTEIQ